MTEKPTIGRIVHFTMPDNQIRPAIIVRTFPHEPFQPQKVNLQLFTDGPNDTSEREGVVWKSEVRQSETPEPSCWHWPAATPAE